jgi:hypothetical protein
MSPTPATPQLRQELRRVFEPEQANLLADAFAEAFASQARMADEMSALRGEVRQLAGQVQQLAQAQQQLAQAQQQLTQAQQRTEHAVLLLARQVGGLSEKLGGSLEDLAIETVPAVLAEAWSLSEVECGRDIIEHAGVEHELDLVLRAQLPSGEPLVVLGEVKSRLTRSEVDGLVDRARRLGPVFAPAEVRLLFFGFQCGREARERIREIGAYMVFSNGRLL